MNGKPGMKKKADSLLRSIIRMVDKNKTPADDPYMDELTQISKNLKLSLMTNHKKCCRLKMKKSYQ